MAADILESLIKTNLAATAAVLAVLAMRQMTRRAFGARVAYTLWLAVPLAVGASLLPSRTIVLPFDGSAAHGDVGIRATTVAAGLDATPALVTLWLAGAVISFGLLAWSQSRFMRSLGGVVREGKILRARRAGPGPAVVGALFPRIVLPADFEDRYDASEQKMVLAHEKAHLASGDAVINALVALARCLFWFNPLINVASRILRVDQELACDAAVLKSHPQLRHAYAQALLKTQLAASSLPIGCYWPARGLNPLKERIAMLTLQSPSRAVRLAGGVGILALCLGIAAAAWAAQPARIVIAEPRPAAASAPLAPVTLAQARSIPAASTPPQTAGDPPRARSVPPRPTQIQARPAPANPAPTIPLATSIAGRANSPAGTATSILPRLPPPNPAPAAPPSALDLTPSAASTPPQRAGSRSIVVPKPFTADVKAQTLQQVDAWIATLRAEGRSVDAVMKARDDLALTPTVD